jgi:hypothetical protein
VPHGTKAPPESGFYNPDGLLDERTFAVGPVRDRNNPYESDAGINLGPRVGFAYNPDGQSRTVLRGGVGVFFSSQVPGAMWQSAQPAPGIPFRMRISRLDAARLGLKWPVYNDDLRKVLDAEVKSTGVINSFSIFDPTLQNPYTAQFMLGVQRELTSKLAVDRVCRHARVQLPHAALGQPARPRDGCAAKPAAQRELLRRRLADTDYLSWQSSMRKRLSQN